MLREQRMELREIGWHVPWKDGGPSGWRPSNLSHQGQQEENHVVTVAEPLLPQSEVPCAFAPQVPVSPEVLLVVLPDSPR